MPNGRRYYKMGDTGNLDKNGRKTPMEKRREPDIRGRLRAVSASRGMTAVLLAATAAGMFLLNLLTPYVADDFVYMVDLSTKERLSGIADIFPSMAVHARRLNGRLISHGLGQLFMLWPKAVFDVVNALVYAAFLWLVCRLARLDRRRDGFLLAGVGMAFWLFTPSFGQVALWAIGSVNYLWALFFGLLYVRPYVLRFAGGTECCRRIWQKVIFCLLALPLGMYTEITSFVALFLAAALLLLDRIVHGKSMKTWLWIPVAAAAAGYVLLLSMPAELAAKQSEFSLGRLVGNLNVCVNMLMKYGTAPLCVWAAAFAVALLGGAGRDRLVLSGLFACGALGADIMPVAASYYPERCFCTTVTLLILATAVLIPELVRLKETKTCAAALAVLTVLWAFSAATGAYDVWNVHGAMRARAEDVERQRLAGAGVVSVPVITPATRYSALYGLEDLGDDPEAFPNFHMAQWYGVEGIVREK